MNIKLTILNIAAGLFLLGCIIFMAFNYQKLSEGEGWGVLGMIGLLGVSVFLLVIDFIIQKVFKNRETINTISTIITIAEILLLLLK